MAEAFNTIDSNPKVKYAFHFGSSNKLVHLTQEQLDLIPYLSTLVARKDDFLSIQNETGEYVLNHPIDYTWFMAILRSITSQHPYRLFDELPEDDNVWDTLQLFDYLGIKSFPLPLLKCEDLVRSKLINNEDQNQRVKYHEANLSEARRTAAEFIIALAKNEYKLRDSNTMNIIFNLINIILFNAAIFNLRFRYHTLTIVKKRCYSFFTKNQQRQLKNSHRIPQYEKINSNKFQNIFRWRGVYAPIEDKKPLPRRSHWSHSVFPLWEFHRPKRDYVRGSKISLSHPVRNSVDIPLNCLIFPVDEFNWSRENKLTIFSFRLTSRRIKIPSSDEILDPFQTRDNRKVLIDELKRDRRKEEAQSARSGRFKSLSTRSNIDKFKHRSGPKAPKYR